LTYSGYLTHISGHPSATSRTQNSESTPAKDRCSTAGPCNLRVNGRFPREPGFASFPQSSSSNSSGTDPLVSCSQAGCPSYHPTNSVKALKETQSTDHNQRPGLILSTFTTGLIRKWLVSGLGLGLQLGLVLGLMSPVNMKCE